MLINTDYSTVGKLIDEILDIVKPIPENVTDKEREEKDTWRQAYVMSCHFSEWDPETLKKFLEKIKRQKEKNEKIDYLNFGGL